MRPRFQIVVIGSGFAGSLLAMVAQRLGFSTALIERGRHPRFAIGESSTPLANLLLEEIADEYDLPFVRPLSKWGSWQEEAPHISCGIKRGFTFYHHEPGGAFETDPLLERQLLVGASPNEATADTHWYRPEFDDYLAWQAQSLGVTFWDQVELSKIDEEESGIRLSGARQGEPIALTGEFVIDATGPRGFLHRALGLAEKKLPLLPPTQALFSHFTGVAPLSGSFFVEGKVPPYPPEQAAVHHVFSGGWVWVLRFNNGITSAGVAATDAIANTLDLRAGESGWKRLLEKLPSLREIFECARAAMPFVHQPRIAFQTAQVVGSRWAMLPSAAGFVDPLLSTGFPLTLLGVARLGRLLRDHWGKPSFRIQLDEYARWTTLELETTARLVGALYSTMDRFSLFKQLSLLYFAAAHYSETARRSGKRDLADSFLLCGHPEFSKALREICESVRAADATQITERIRRTIKPFDLIGLTDPAKGPWYSALPMDLCSSAPRQSLAP